MLQRLSQSSDICTRALMHLTMDWEIILTEIKFKTSRSSGAGGQHVNKTETRVEALLDIPLSQGLDVEEKQILLEALANRINKEGALSVVSSVSRSQLDNKQHAIDKMQALLIKALTPVKKRKPTRIPKAVKEERLSEKRKISEKKENRKRPEPK